MVSKSDMGFQTRTWSAAWHFLHMVSLNYPVQPSAEIKSQYRQYFVSLGHVLPCKSCRESYAKVTRAGPLKLTRDVFKNRQTLSRWLYNVHNNVAKRTGSISSISKPQITYPEMCRRYEKCRATICGGHKCDVPDAKQKKRCVTLLVSEEKFKKSRNLRALVAGQGHKKVNESFVDLS